MEYIVYKNLKDVRKILLMTSKNLAEKLDKAPSTLSAIEAREVTGSVTIRILQEIAECIGFDLKYEYVPKICLTNTLLRKTAKKVACKNLKGVRAILQMNSKNFAKKINKASSTLSELEAREATGNVTIKNLQDIAEGIGFELKYEYVPRESLTNTMLQQAIKQVKSELKNAHQYTDDVIELDAIQLIKERKPLDW